MELDTTKGYEFYLRHILLLGKAAPIPLMAIVQKAVEKRNENLELLLTKSKPTWQILFPDQYFKLFLDDTVNTDIKSWDTRLLCIVISLLFVSDLSETECNAITCVMKQRNDLDNYAATASLDYKTYETKWCSLHEALLEMLTTSSSNANYECKRLIHSFAKEPVQLNVSLIEKLKENKDMTEQVKMAIDHKVSRIFCIKDDAVSGIKGGIEDDTIDSSEIDVQIIQGLQNLKVKESETLTLECKFTKPDIPVKWLKNQRELVPNNRIEIFSWDCFHRLIVAEISEEDSAVYTCTAGNVRSECYVQIEVLPASFYTNLQDTNVNENDKVDLTCEANSENILVKWYKASDRLAATNNMSFTKDGRRHCLEIVTAGLDDTGIYSCLSSNGEALTSAYVNVKEIPVELTDHLTDTDVYEGDDVTLTCEVNVLKKTATWFYDNREIQYSSVRRSISSHGKKHSLTILNAKLYDDGRYRVVFGEVSSEAILTVKDTTSDLHKQQLTKQNYRNWVRGSLSLLYLKQGLTDFSNKCMKKQHADILQKLPTSTIQCTQCNVETLMPFKKHANNKQCYKRSCLCSKKPKSPQKRVLCPNGGFCSKFYDLILAEHRHNDLCLTNTDIPAWISDPWSVGTCFVNTPGYKNKKSAQEIDCSGLLSVFINDRFFNSELGDVRIDGKSDLFKQARDARNDILHNPNYELSESELIRYIDLFKDVLEVRNAANKKPLENEPGTPEALQNLERLQTRQIDIDDKVYRLTETIGEQEIADILEKAQKEMEEKINVLKTKMKEKDEQLKLLRQVWHCEPPYQKAHFEVVFDLTIIVSGSTAENAKLYNDKILESARHALQSSNRRNPSWSTLDLVMETETLVDVLLQIPGVTISLADDPVLIMKISITSYDGLNRFLILMNGKVLRQKIYLLRKCIEKNIEESVEVTARITSDSFSEVKNQLNGTDMFNDTHGDFKCKYHPWMENAWYCIEHGEFCCTTCKANEHRSCEGIKKVISEINEKKVEESIFMTNEKKEYNVRIGNIFHRDKEVCNITGICVLPNHKILLVDYRNNRLKKLNSSLKLLSHCDLPDEPYDVCYIGNNVAVVCHLFPRWLQFVDVSGNMRLKQTVPLTFICRGLDCHTDTLYVTGGNSVYTCNTDGTQQQLLYTSDSDVWDIAVSDDGEKIYLTGLRRGLVTIDNEGNHLSTLRTDEVDDVNTVCTVGDGTVLISDLKNNCVVQVDYEGKIILGTVVPTTDSLENVMSLCFDRQQCRLMVGRRHYDKIFVLQQK